jgi:hypothetical protein
VFEPSPDHERSVDGYVLEMIVPGDAVPLLRQPLGKPAVTGGECRVDVSSLLQLLPRGSFMAVVKAFNAFGASAGGVSPEFVW